jgi:hypothetical protein
MFLSHIKCKDKLTQINGHLYLLESKAHHLVCGRTFKMDSPRQRSLILGYTCRPPLASISQLQHIYENNYRQVVHLVHKQVIHSWTHLGGQLTPKELWN